MSAPAPQLQVTRIPTDLLVLVPHRLVVTEAMQREDALPLLGHQAKSPDQALLLCFECNSQRHEHMCRQDGILVPACEVRQYTLEVVVEQDSESPPLPRPQGARTHGTDKDHLQSRGGTRRSASGEEL